MSKLKNIIEILIGYIMTTPILQESIRVVMDYDTSLWIYKIMFLAIFSIIGIIGLIIIIDGFLKLVLDKGIKELIYQ